MPGFRVSLRRSNVPTVPGTNQDPYIVLYSKSPNSSLHFSFFQVSIYGASDTSEDVPQIEWVRAKDLATDPRMFVEGPTRFDVNQASPISNSNTVVSFRIENSRDILKLYLFSLFFPSP